MRKWHIILLAIGLASLSAASAAAGGPPVGGAAGVVAAAAWPWSDFGLGGLVIGALFGLILYLIKALGRATDAMVATASALAALKTWLEAAGRHD